MKSLDDYISLERPEFMPKPPMGLFDFVGEPPQKPEPELTKAEVIENRKRGARFLSLVRKQRNRRLRGDA